MPRVIKARKKGKPRGRTGRRPTGLAPGEKLSDYPRLTVRVPPDVVALLKATAKRRGLAEWRVLVEAIRAYAIEAKGHA